MFGGGELGGEAGSADQLGGRVRHPQFRIALLKRDEFMEQRVELGIRDDRRVFDVVPELVFTHRLGEFLPASADIRVDRIDILIVGGHPRRLPS